MIAALVLLVFLPGSASASVSLTAARSKAIEASASWSAGLPTTLGAEPAGACRQIPDGRAACRLGLAMLGDEPAEPKPHRCSATALVSGTPNNLAVHRTDVGCTPFPAPAASPDPVAAFGAAFVLHATGDLTCLPAIPRRSTCVLRYLTWTGQRCHAAASIPENRPAHARALGAARCI
jgi:hypothetical protein